MELSKKDFRPAQGRSSQTQLPQTPPRSSLQDALRRFLGNKASAFAGVIIALLLLFALLTPLFSPYSVGFRDGFYRTMPPLFARNTRLSGPQAVLDYHTAIGAEYDSSAVTAVKNRVRNEDTGRFYYDLSVDAYEKVGFQYVDLSEKEFEALQAYQAETGHQVCYPLPKNYTRFYPAVSSSANLWYQLADDSTYSTGEAARRMNEVLAQQKYRIAGLEKQIFILTAKGYAGRGDVVHFEEDLEPAAVRDLADAIGEVCGGTAAVFSGSDGSGYSYCLVSRQGDLRQLGKAMTQALRGRGGGKPGFQQGRVQAAKSEIVEFFANL